MNKNKKIFTNLQLQFQRVDPELLDLLEENLVTENSKHTLLNTRQIEIHGYPFTVEVAKTRRQKSLGLSGRKYLPNGTGMIFHMEGSPARFHMRNTFIPLDIIYLDSKNIVIKKDQMQPITGKSFCDAEVSKAIELPLGTSDAIGIKTGDFIDIGSQDIVRKVVRETLLWCKETNCF